MKCKDLAIGRGKENARVDKCDFPLLGCFSFYFTLLEIFKSLLSAFFSQSSFDFLFHVRIPEHLLLPSWIAFFYCSIWEVFIGKAFGGYTILPIMHPANSLFTLKTLLLGIEPSYPFLPLEDYDMFTHNYWPFEYW